MELGYNNKVLGSIIYEHSETADLVLNFYSASLEERRHELMDFPQEPQHQSWAVDYPMLAYKTMSPDNREIALVHLAHDIPQRVINLSKGFRFVCFVNGSNERNDTACQIMFLVKNRNNDLQLMMIKADPWKHIDRDNVFNEQESVFMF